jgi:pheromone shutdown protein TraB
MIKTIGSNHLMNSAAIEGIIKNENPDIICLELCNFRENAILNEIKTEVKEKTLLGEITNSIKQKAEKAGLDYGSDQKTALRYAINNKLNYFLVDMPILKTQELFSKLPSNEQEGFLKDLTAFESEPLQKEVNEEEVLFSLKQKYPIAFEFLVNMRNLYITKEILKVQRDNPDKKILVILGKGHVRQIEIMIKGGMN